MKPIAYEFVAVSDEGLQLRCPDCGEVFFSRPDECIGCPDCNAEAESDIDPAEFAAGVDTEDIDPVDMYGRDDEAYAMADNDPNPYEGTYSEE